MKHPLEAFFHTISRGRSAGLTEIGHRCVCAFAQVPHCFLVSGPFANTSSTRAREPVDIFWESLKIEEGNVRKHLALVNSMA